MTQCQVRGHSTYTYILVLFPLWWVCQRRYLPQALLCDVSTSVSSPWQVSQCNKLFSFLHSCLPLKFSSSDNSCCHTYKKSRERFRLHPDKGFSLFPFRPLRFEDKHLFFPPIVSCILRHNLWLKQKHFTEVTACTDTFILVCFGASWQEWRQPVGSLAERTTLRGVTGGVTGGAVNDTLCMNQQHCAAARLVNATAQWAVVKYHVKQAR